MQDLLVATVIHDLKNELAVLTGSLATMTRNASGTALESEVRRSRAIADRLSKNLVSFLTIYRAEQHGLPVCCSDHNHGDFLHDLVKGQPLPANSPSVRVATNESVAPFWFFDAYLVQLAMEAALHNALRFARSAIDMSARTRDGFLVMVVEDDGPGPGAAGAPSTGLGTALCSAIAEAHRNGDRRGKVTLGTRPAGGAIFEMWLP